LFAALVSTVFSTAIEPAAFKSNGDAIAAELTIMNFLLVKPLHFESMPISLTFIIFGSIPNQAAGFNKFRPPGFRVSLQAFKSATLQRMRCAPAWTIAPHQY
jgi:hypothetical protein